MLNRLSMLCLCDRTDLGLHTVGICEALRAAGGPDEDDDPDEEKVYA